MYVYVYIYVYIYICIYIYTKYVYIYISSYIHHWYSLVFRRRNIASFTTSEQSKWSSYLQFYMGYLNDVQTVLKHSTKIAKIEIHFYMDFLYINIWIIIKNIKFWYNESSLAFVPSNFGSYALLDIAAISTNFSSFFIITFDWNENF